MDRPPLRLFVTQPAPPRERGGNRVTALRWAKLLRRLGARVAVRREWDGEPCDALVALHARKSLPSIRRFRAAHPDRPLVVAATGTDLYVDLPGGGPAAAEARAGFAAADRIVVLQDHGPEALPPALRARARVVHQSAPAPPPGAARRDDAFEVCVLASLRAVKDPLLTARAARRLGAASRVRVLHAGAPIEPALLDAALREAAENPRYEWRGELPRAAALALLARGRALVSSSRQEGGANVLTEAFALGVPVLATRVAGSVGLLGPDHPGLFEVGDAAGLAALLARAESDAAFLADLARRSAERAWMADPARELAAWRALLDELFPAAAARAEGA